MAEYKGLKINEKRLFKVAVVATMSSGKSTIINALAGQELLPAINQACTAKTLCLLDNDKIERPAAHVIHADHTYEHIDPCGKETIERFNNDRDNEITDIIVECNIEGVHNAYSALMLIDTPGVNNSLDAGHEGVTMNLLSNMEEGMLLYVLNATQPTTQDNENFLLSVQKVLEKKPKVRIVFVLNKMDQLDPSKEDPAKLVEKMAKYIRELGFKNFTILPISAEAALLFKQAMRSESFGKSAKCKFDWYYECFGCEQEKSYGYQHMLWDEKLHNAPNALVNGKEYKPIDLQRALENTGIPQLEKYIEKELLQSAVAHAPWVKKVKNK